METTKQGFLTKEGGSYKSWHRRWCVLKNGCLHYSKSADKKALGIIRLDEAADICETDKRPKRKNCFIVETPNRTYFIAAETKQDMESWIKELRAERDRMQGVTTEPEATPAVQSKAPATSTPGNSSTGTPGQSEKVAVEDFDLLKVIGKGSFGKVFQVRKKDTAKIYAMKVLNKKTIIERNELEHTKAERSILQKLCHPFLVNLNYSFQTPDKLYFIMDFVNGGELFFHLQKDRQFSEERVRFYSAEIVLGLEYLHRQGVLYRDLKPENLLLTADGHICMTDFGISKEGLISEDDRTATFCGTPEYLAPEVLEGNGYGKAVDWWSFGTLMYEMLTGLPPFYSQDVQQMYSKIMSAKLTFPKSIGEEARDLLEKLLVRDPEKRLTNPDDIKSHPFFAPIDWSKLEAKEVPPPFVPEVKGAEDTSQVDPTFTQEEVALSQREDGITRTMQENFDGFTYVADSGLE